MDRKRNEIKKYNLLEINANKDHQIILLEKMNEVIKIDEKQFVFSENTPSRLIIYLAVNKRCSC